MEKRSSVFFVEGDKTLADIYVPRVEEVGWKVVRTISFSETQRRLKRSVPQVFIVDVEDDEESEALAFFSHLRSIASLSAIPVIVLTHAPSPSFIQTMHEQGMHACFLKAYTRPATLLKILSQLGFENKN